MVIYKIMEALDILVENIKHLIEENAGNARKP